MAVQPEASHKPLCASVLSEDDPTWTPGQVLALPALHNRLKEQGSMDGATL